MEKEICVQEKEHSLLLTRRLLWAADCHRQRNKERRGDIFVTRNCRVESESDQMETGKRSNETEVKQILLQKNRFRRPQISTLRSEWPKCIKKCFPVTENQRARTPEFTKRQQLFSTRVKQGPCQMSSRSRKQHLNWGKQRSRANLRFNYHLMSHLCSGRPLNRRICRATWMFGHQGRGRREKVTCKLYRLCNCWILFFVEEKTTMLSIDFKFF